MRGSKKMMLAATLLVGAAAMTGCAADTRSAPAPTQQAAQQQTAQPATAQPDVARSGGQADGQTETSVQPSPEATEEPESSRRLVLMVNGGETDAPAVMEHDSLLLPLIQTGEALGFKADSNQTEEETQTRRQITLQKDDSRITVSYEVSDNTIRRISWQKDGLLIPVDTRIETIEETVYVPAAFFEEAMDVKITEREGMVEVSSPEPMDTPQTNQ